ncbi:MAG: LacI family DNA-binding transcriptional regulator [Verrucomicrobia bacterium]|nr:LacI family DNA-binding transcriptional regulator [Verrucomicrobiota bacterium]
MPPTPPIPARVSLRDVAREVGVSHMAVSLALRGDTRISEARRTEIKAAAVRLGYRPDPMLSSLAAYRRAKQAVPISATLVWINQWEDPRALRRLREFDAYWRGAAETAEQLGYRLEEFVVGPGLSPERLQEILRARSVRGLLLPPHRHGLSLAGFDWSEYSVVRLGLSVPEPRAHAVVCDHSDCVTLAYARIHAHGYRRIGFVSSPMFDHNTRGNFRAGYLRQQADLASARDRLKPLLLDETPGPANLAPLRAWLATERPDAIITSLPLMRGLLAKLGVRVPRDLAVATTSVLDGNFPAGIDQNCHEIGAVALRMLAGLIHQNERGVPRFFRRTLVEGRWVDGPSLPVKSPAAL